MGKEKAIGALTVIIALVLGVLYFYGLLVPDPEWPVVKLAVSIFVVISLGLILLLGWMMATT